MDDPATGSQKAVADRLRSRAAAAASDSDEALVAIAGLSFGVARRGPEHVSSALDDLFGRLPAGHPPCDVRLRCSDHRPPPVETEPVARWPGLAVHVGPDGTVVVGGELTARVGHDEIVLAGDDPSAHRVLPIALGHALISHDRFLAHAALLVNDRSGVLVVGPTGAGKSTMAFAAAQAAGWSVRSDDLAVLRQEAGGTVVAAGLPRRARVPGELAENSSLAPAGDPRGRVHLELADVGDEVPIEVVVVLTQTTAAHGGVREVAPMEAFDLLMHSSFGSSDPLGVRAWMPVAGALSRGPVGGVVLGGDVTRRAEDAVTALRQVVAGG